MPIRQDAREVKAVGGSLRGSAIRADTNPFSDGAVLAVFASHPFDPADYRRDYAEFRPLVTAM
jgi:WxcM-like, C-terminal